jgi:Rrf2 family transcriptional regulator, nitric oxide-sensitive transcriptional repressor
MFHAITGGRLPFIRRVKRPSGGSISRAVMSRCRLRSTVREAASLFNVPYAHLVKVAHQLGQMGFLATTKGAGGGLRLARPAESIRIGEILRITERSEAVIECTTQPCPLVGACLLKGALDTAYAAFLDTLDQYTIAQVARTPRLQKLVYLKP